MEKRVRTYAGNFGGEIMTQKKSKVIGIVPARMAASRFPGKPMFPILGRPMIEHVVLRAKQYAGWDGLFLATCDSEIEDFGRAKDWPVIMTSPLHTRCLDRVAEAVEKCGIAVDAGDIIVCVQGDEPMLHPNMVDAVTQPLLDDPSVPCTVLAMDILEEDQFLNPNTVKIIHNNRGEVLYTSRAPVPYVKGKFTPELGARRIYGIFAFRWKYLKKFNEIPETRLERLEACDSNRILDSDFRQIVAPYPYVKSFSVDSPEDIGLVEKSIEKDSLWGSY
jgi:3-deoxy-manno-octulosonate cytidylyltransferase (CMP-KDO synthetase)